MEKKLDYHVKDQKVGTGTNVNKEIYKQRDTGSKRNYFCHSLQLFFLSICKICKLVDTDQIIMHVDTTGTL